MSGKCFKKCTGCDVTWTTRDGFLSDSRIELVGYQAHFENLELGLLIFNHHICKTSLALTVEQLADLYQGPVFQERMEKSDECPAYCLDKNNLDPCPERCECAYVREIIQTINNWEKASCQEK